MTLDLNLGQSKAQSHKNSIIWLSIFKISWSISVIVPILALILAWSQHPNLFVSGSDFLGHHSIPQFSTLCYHYTCNQLDSINFLHLTCKFSLFYIISFPPLFKPFLSDLFHLINLFSFHLPLLDYLISIKNLCRYSEMMKNLFFLYFSSAVQS